MQIRKRIDVLIVFEHITRELETCLSLKYELLKLNLSCEIVPLHFNKYATNLIFQPKLVILPFLNSQNDYTLARIREIYGDSVIGLNLHHEQLYNEGTKKFMLPKDEYSRKVYHLSWTEKFASDLIESGVEPKKINILRNPRFDSVWLKSPALQKFNISHFEEVIFFPTTFAWAFVSEEYFLGLGNIEKDTFYRMRDVTDLTARKYFNAISYFAIKYPHKLFMVRPHPYEDIDYFRKKFIEYTQLSELPDNILIEREGNVYDWIKISALVIGWCTTTNIEAAMCNKCSVVFHPVKYPEDMNLSFFEDFDIVTDIAELEEFISGIRRPVVSSEILDKFSETYGFPQHPVCPNIAAWVFEILAQTEFDDTINIKAYIVNAFNFIIKDIPKKLLVESRTIHLLNKNYAGLYEDCISYKKLKEHFKTFTRSNA